MRRILFYLLFISAFLGPAISYHGVYLFHFSLIAWFVNFFIEEKQKASQWLNTALKSKFFWIVPALMGWFLLSLLWTESIKQGLVFTAQLGFGLSVATVTGVELSRDENRTRFNKLMLILLAITLLVGIVEVISPFRWPISAYSSLNHWFGYSGDKPLGAFEKCFLNITPTSFFWNPNDLALVLVIFYPFVFLLKKQWRWLIMLSILLLSFFAGGRLAIIAIIIEHVGVLFILRKTVAGEFILGILAFILLASFPFFLKLGSGNESLALVEKSKEFGSMIIKKKYPAYIHPVLTKSSVSVRKELTIKGIAFLTHSKGLGIGAGSVEVLLGKEKGGGEKHIVNLHNTWLELICEGGLVVLILLMFWWSKSMKQLIQLSNSGNSLQKEKYRLLLLSVVCSCFALISLSSAIYFLPFYLFLGYMVSHLKEIAAE